MCCNVAVFVAGNDEQRWTSVHRRGFAQVARAGADAEWHTRGVTVMHVRLLAARSVVPSLPRSLQCIHSSQTNSCGPSSFSRSPHTICMRWQHTCSGDSSAGCAIDSRVAIESAEEEKRVCMRCADGPHSVRPAHLFECAWVTYQSLSLSSQRTRSCALASLPQDGQPTTTLRTSASARTA
jgi:hypothetical protein